MSQKTSYRENGFIDTNGAHNVCRFISLCKIDVAFPRNHKFLGHAMVKSMGAIYTDGLLRSRRCKRIVL